MNSSDKMTYSLEINPLLEKILVKLKKKDNIMYQRVLKKMSEIIEEPYHYKPLSHSMAGIRRVHLDPLSCCSP